MLPLKRKAVTLKTCTVFPVSGVVPSIVRTTFTYDSHDGDADDVDILYIQYAFACLLLRCDKKSVWQWAWPAQAFVRGGEEEGEKVH